MRPWPAPRRSPGGRPRRRCRPSRAGASWRSTRASERVPHRDVELGARLVGDPARGAAHAEGARAPPGLEAGPAARAGLERVEVETRDLGRHRAGVHEHRPAQPAPDREAPLEVQDRGGIAADRIALRSERAPAILAEAADRGGPSGEEPVLDGQRVGTTVGRGEAETAGGSGPRRARPLPEPSRLEPSLDELHVAAEVAGAGLHRDLMEAAARRGPRLLAPGGGDAAGDTAC